MAKLLHFLRCEQVFDVTRIADPTSRKPPAAGSISAQYRLFGCDPVREDETVISALEAVFAGGLILRAMIPGLRVFIAGELKDEDLLERGPLQDFLTTVAGAKNNRVFLETGGSQLLILIQLSLISGLFARNYARKRAFSPPINGCLLVLWS